MRSLVVGWVLAFLAGCAVAAVAAPGAYFEKVSDLSSDNDSFKNGYVAGVYDTISVFAKAAQGGSIDNQKTLRLFGCLDGQGDKLSSLRSWADGVWHGASGSGSAVQPLIDRCLP